MRLGTNMKKGLPFRKVAVLMGGVSAEREVSLRSGAAVARGLAEAGYETIAQDVRTRRLSLPAGVEAVFLALHGEFGEDGQIQSRLDRMGMPYTGSGARASRLAFDKTRSKRVFVEAGIPTPEYEILRQGQVRTLPLPVVVKPARQGSSIGVHRVCREDQWDAALSDALAHGRDAVVERYVPGRELTVGLVGDRALPVVEIVADDNWYDYQAKYASGRTQYRKPVGWSEIAQRECRNRALAAYRALGCRGFGRADFRAAEEGAPLLLEINTLPGFTESSLLPKSARLAGLSFSALCDAIMRLAACAPTP
jgi:D-alanine-D-alanine ligase